ncbi:hypothetical protein [Actinoplanes sp. NPDC049118]|uniref:hypothetical protein n=1 Tax=Actinoplanes sp. NPDC049118 TaxID=3155769 RepID=UPI0033FD8AF2
MRLLRILAVAVAVGLVVASVPPPASAAATYQVKFAIAAAAKVSGRFMYVWDRSTWNYHVVQGDGDSPAGTAQLPPGDYLAVARVFAGDAASTAVNGGSDYLDVK